jgi:hypothetical protein
MVYWLRNLASTKFELRCNGARAKSYRCGSHDDSAVLGKGFRGPEFLPVGCVYVYTIRIFLRCVSILDLRGVNARVLGADDNCIQRLVGNHPVVVKETDIIR